MPELVHGHESIITSDMTLLDIVSRYRQTEAVFRKYDEQAGVCLCCQALFDPLETVAERYGLDLQELVAALDSAVAPVRRP